MMVSVKSLTSTTTLAAPAALLSDSFLCGSSGERPRESELLRCAIASARGHALMTVPGTCVFS